MNQMSKVSETIISFCACTTCIVLLQGIMGMLFFPDELLPYDAFLTAPIMGALSVLFGMVTWSKRELTVKEVLVRRFIHLLMIEGMVFGLNYLAGNVFTPVVSVTLTVGVAVVFAAVYFVLWLIDSKSATLFNQQLKKFQEMEKQKEM